MKIIHKKRSGAPIGRKNGKGKAAPAEELQPTRSRSVLPPVAVLEVTELSADGEVFARPVQWEDPRREPPRILLVEGTKGQTPALGQRVLAKMQSGSRKHYTAQILRILPEKAAIQALGVFEPLRQGGLLKPVNRKQKQDYFLSADQTAEIKKGELLLCEAQANSFNRQLGIPEARIIERLGDVSAPRSFSLIAIHHNDIPTVFPEAAVAEASAATDPVPDGRVDLRETPLITIDGEDARDFDDAVFAEPDGEGWHLIVAIADVAHYVTPDSALDKEALQRGNSCYFPDRVVPMLPEALSNGLCSLNPGVDRYCLAVHLWIDAEGNLTRHEFLRGIMRSHARMTYEQVQAEYDNNLPLPMGEVDERSESGEGNNTASPSPGSPNGIWHSPTSPEGRGVMLHSLYGAYRSLLKQRAERGALELDMPEFKIALGEDGKVASVGRRTRLDSHKLIEEFMICANVAAAEAIERHGLDGIFRIHEAPSPTKVEELRSFLKMMDYSLAPDAQAKQISKLLAKAMGTPESSIINSAVLRSQMQAYYSPRNKGHFGLGLQKYCHFTSPIRRYADLMVHRALIEMLGMQDAQQRRRAPNKETQAQLGSIADLISQTERRAMQAEREANDRYIAAHLAGQIHTQFEAVISSVGSFGLFVTLMETGASGIVRMPDLGRDFFVYDERNHSLTGRDRGHRFQLGQRVTVALQEANIALGTLRFSMVRAERLPETKKGKPPYKKSGDKKPYAGKGGDKPAGKYPPKKGGFPKKQKG